MPRVLIIAAMLIASVGGACAQYGPAYPTPSQRGPAFPKHVSPNATNPTNWVAAPPIPEPAPQSRWWGRGRWRAHAHYAHGRRLYLRYR
jgi:hypothetical protein